MITLYNYIRLQFTMQVNCLKNITSEASLVAWANWGIEKYKQYIMFLIHYIKWKYNFLEVIKDKDALLKCYYVR